MRYQYDSTGIKKNYAQEQKEFLDCDEAMEEIIKNEIMKPQETTEATTMKVTYNGMTGELLKLERENPREIFIAVKQGTHDIIPESRCEYLYDLEIYEPEKKATVHFENVNLADVKFSGGEVSFNG